MLHERRYRTPLDLIHPPQTPPTPQNQAQYRANASYDGRKRRERGTIIRQLGTNMVLLHGADSVQRRDSNEIRPCLLLYGGANASSDIAGSIEFPPLLRAHVAGRFASSLPHLRTHPSSDVMGQQTSAIVGSSALVYVPSCDAAVYQGAAKAPVVEIVVPGRPSVHSASVGMRPLVRFPPADTCHAQAGWWVATDGSALGTDSNPGPSTAPTVTPPPPAVVASLFATTPVVYTSRRKTSRTSDKPLHSTSAAGGARSLVTSLPASCANQSKEAPLNMPAHHSHDSQYQTV